MDSSERNTPTPRGSLPARPVLIVAVTVLTVGVGAFIVAPHDPLVLGVSLVVGVVSGVGIAAGWSRYLGRLRRVAEIEAATGLPVLGVIPRLRTGGTDRIWVDAHRPARVAGAYAYLTARLGQSPEQSAARCLLITSPARAAGRTTIAVNVAASVAADGLKVALVSADSRSGRPLDRVLGLRARPGLTEVLAGSCSLDSALQESGAERLRVLPVGAATPHRGVGYNFDHLARLLDRLTKRVDLVVIDAPPVLESPETALLAQEADLVLVAVDVRHDKRATTSRAMSYLGHVEDRLIGCVANDPGRRRHGHLLRRRFVAAAHAVGRVPAAVGAAVGSALGGVGAALGAREQRGSRRRWLGAAAFLAAMGLLASSLWWLSYDERSDAHPDDGETSTSSLARVAPSDQAAVEAAMNECRSQWDAQSAPLHAAATSLAQWELHVTAMNQLVAGEITLAQANRFWERTREGAADKVDRFFDADGRYASGDYTCHPPASAGEDAEVEGSGFSACQDDIAQRGRALQAARVALGTWHHHVMDMNLLRAGKLSPERAVRLWRKYWREGVAELDEYRAQLRRTDDGGC